MMKKVKEILKKMWNNKLYWGTFLVATIIINILYIFNGVTPYGDKSLLCIDFYHQYGPMLGELFDRVRGGSNLMYSFSMGLGLPFYRNFLNYLSSPFNIIMFLFNKKGLLTSYSFIIGAKAVFASVSFVYFLAKKFDRKDLILMPLGILYGFSAYYSSYYWNIMWLDGMVFLPLITLGIEYLVKDGKWKFYTIFLSLMLVSNYFIGYMICIFSVVYFALYSIYEFKFKKKEIKDSFKKLGKNIIKFGIASLFAGFLGAGLLLPMFTSISSISATGGSWPTSQYYDFKLVDFLMGHFSGVKTTTFASDTITNPNISCGILSIGAFLLFIFNIEIPFKKKIVYLLLLGFFILAFFNCKLDYIIQAFHVPNDLPYRYSFIYSFVLLIISAYAILNVRKLPYPFVVVCYIFLMVITFATKALNWNDITDNMIYINMILLTLYFIFYSGVYFIYDLKNIFYVALIIVAALDVIVSINTNWNITQVKSVFYEDYKATTKLLKEVKEQDDELFYRIENTNMMTLNDPSWYGYYGMTTFSSMAYESMAKLQRNLGQPGNQINSYYYAQTTPIYDLMFDMKYFIGDPIDETRYAKLIEHEETANVFKDNIGLAFGVKKDILKWDYQTADPFYNENDFMKNATGIENVLKQAEIIKTEEVAKNDSITLMKYSIKNPHDNMYFYTTSYNIDFFYIGETVYFKENNYVDILSENDLYYSYTDDYKEEKIIGIISDDDVIELYVGYSSYINDSFNLYYIDSNNWNLAIDYLKDYKFNITDFKEDNIKGYIELDSNMYVYTSIPYDEGWHVYIDGKEVITESLGDALLTFRGKAGKHNIEFKYRAKHMLSGFLISILTGAIMILDYKYHDIIISSIKIKLPKKKKIKKTLLKNKKK